MSQRKITVVNTTGVGKNSFSSNAKTWGQLQSELTERKITYSGMSAIIGENQNSLESTKATLPEFDFHLFLSPKKVKSGAIDAQTASYSQLRTEIKSLCATNEKAKSYFGNYTHSTTEDLRKNLTKWYGKSSSVSTTKPTKVTATAAPKAVAKPAARRVAAKSDSNVSKAIGLLEGSSANISQAVKLLEDTEGVNVPEEFKQYLKEKQEADIRIQVMLEDIKKNLKN